MNNHAAGSAFAQQLPAGRSYVEDGGACQTSQLIALGISEWIEARAAVVRNNGKALCCPRDITTIFLSVILADIRPPLYFSDTALECIQHITTAVLLRLHRVFSKFSVLLTDAPEPAINSSCSRLAMLSPILPSSAFTPFQFGSAEDIDLLITDHGCS